MYPLYLSLFSYLTKESKRKGKGVLRNQIRKEVKWGKRKIEVSKVSNLSIQGDRFPSIKMIYIQQIASGGEDVEKLESLCILGGNIK